MSIYNRNSLFFCVSLANCLSWCIALVPAPASAQTLDQLREMSIDDLGRVNVSSASKTEQPLSDAAAAIYVISRDDIIRSGAVTLPEMLRLAPNLQVYKTSPSNWVVTTRGLNGNSSSQSFSNKLLVLIDGRTVYTPLFSGVYWDLPDLNVTDIEKIEVISGPGATLWGANAVNGVINVITRSSAETSGTYVAARGGADQRMAVARYGGSVGDTLSYRVHFRWLNEDAERRTDGTSAHDGWHRLGGGIRLDWKPNERDEVSLTGEIFDGSVNQPGDAHENIGGRNLSLRWTREHQDGSEIQVQGFYDRIERASKPEGGSFHVDTYDFEVQHRFTLGERHKIVWGAGARQVRYAINGTPSFFFEPSSRKLLLANGFVQDSFSVTADLTLIGGIKLEKTPYAGLSLLPEIRVAWKPDAATLIWASASRAVRSPTPFDVDVEERAGIVKLSGNPDFRTEKLTAHELGLRMQPVRRLSFSATAYYHKYDDLRSIEILPGPGLILMWDNKLTGHSYGVDAWGEWQATPWWTLSAGVALFKPKFRFKEGASGILGTAQLGTDPSYQFKLRSSINVGKHIRFDTDLRAVDKLEGSTVKGYVEVGGRLAWLLSRTVVLSVSGTNLLHDHHQEYPGGDPISRKILMGAELRF